MRKKIIAVSVMLMVVFGIILIPKYEVMRINSTLDLNGIKLNMHINEVEKTIKSIKERAHMMGAYGFDYPEEGFSIFYGFDCPLSTKDRVVRIHIYDKKHSILGVRVGDNVGDAYKALISMGFYYRRDVGIRNSFDSYEIYIESENKIVTQVIISAINHTGVQY